MLGTKHEIPTQDDVESLHYHQDVECWPHFLGLIHLAAMILAYPEMN